LYHVNPIRDTNFASDVFTSFLKEPMASIFRVEALKAVGPTKKMLVLPVEYRA